MQILNMLILSIIAIVSCAAQTPPLGGKFFYSDLRSGWVYGMHFIDVLIGFPEKHFQLALSTEEYTAGVVGVACSASRCYVADRFDHSLSQTCVAAGWSATEDTLLFNHKALATARMTTKGFTDVFTTEVYQYQRQT